MAVVLQRLVFCQFNSILTGNLVPELKLNICWLSTGILSVYEVSVKWNRMVPQLQGHSRTQGHCLISKPVMTPLFWKAFVLSFLHEEYAAKTNNNNIACFIFSFFSMTFPPSGTLHDFKLANIQLNGRNFLSA